MRWQDRRSRFRSRLEGGECVHPASVWDPLSMRVAEELGFETAVFAGSVASLAVLGAPDLILLTLSEFSDQAYRINRAGNLPLLVDADHGYGNALNVRRTVEELENAGVAGLTIEDTDLPRPYGSKSKPRLLSVDEGVGKMRAALDARSDPGLVIAGRTSAASLAGLDEAIRRGRAYQASGVDALFFTGVSDSEAIMALGDAFSCPIFLGGSGTGVLADRDFLAGQGVRISLQGHHPFAASVKAAYVTLAALRDGTPADRVTGTASSDVMDRLTRQSDYTRLISEFL